MTKIIQRSRQKSECERRKAWRTLLLCHLMCFDTKIQPQRCAQDLDEATDTPASPHGPSRPPYPPWLRQEARRCPHTAESKRNRRVESQSASSLLRGGPPPAPPAANRIPTVAEVPAQPRRDGRRHELSARRTWRSVRRSSRRSGRDAMAALPAAWQRNAAGVRPQCGGGTRAQLCRDSGRRGQVRGSAAAAARGRVCGLEELWGKGALERGVGLLCASWGLRYQHEYRSEWMPQVNAPWICGCC